MNESGKEKNVKKETKKDFLNAPRPIYVDSKTSEVIYRTPTTSNPNEIVVRPNAYFVPALGYEKFDGHIFVSGATGAGKSYFIKEMLKHDRRRRPVILFSDLQDKDPSLRGIKKLHKYEPNGEINGGWVQANMKGSICLFDDVQFNVDVLQFRDMLLEKGRHHDVVVVCVNHKLRDRERTKVPLNEARFVITFPCANKGAVGRYMRDEFEMSTKKVQERLEEICTTSRYLIFHKHSPQMMASQQKIWYI